MAAVYLNYLSLPVSPNRAEVFAEARGRGPVFVKRIGAWVVLDPPVVARLLQDERLDVPDAVTALGAVEARYGVCFPNLRWAASILPLLVDGKRHRTVRPPLAKHISNEMRRAGSWRDKVPEMVEAALARPGTLEAMGGLLLPCIDVIFEDLVGVAVDFAPLSLTKIFDRYASYRQLVELERNFSALRAKLASIGTPSETEGTLASFIILGRDSMLSSLGESVMQLMTANIGKRLNRPREGSPRLFSGVAIAERTVMEPFTFDDVAFAKGDRIRMYFGGYNKAESETERLAFFGVGAHSCLGRSLGMEAWSLVSSAIVRSPLTVAAVKAQYDRSVVFAMPSYVNIEFV